MPWAQVMTETGVKVETAAEVGDTGVGETETETTPHATFEAGADLSAVRSS